MRFRQTGRHEILVLICVGSTPTTAVYRFPIGYMLLARADVIVCLSNRKVLPPFIPFGVLPKRIDGATAIYLNPIIGNLLVGGQGKVLKTQNDYSMGMG